MADHDNDIDALRGVNVGGLHRSEAELIGKASVWMVDAAIAARELEEANGIAARYKAELSKKIEELAAAWMVKDDLLAELAKVRQQRDEARRYVCRKEALIHLKPYYAHENDKDIVRFSKAIAKQRGWDCFEQQEGGGA